MYFSNEQITQSTNRLNELNPFYGTVFLSFKQEKLPIGETRLLRFQKTMNDFLQKYYLYHPFPEDPAFFFSQKNEKDRRIYTPFSTSNQKTRWNKEPFAGSLRRVAGDTFSNAFIFDHNDKGTRNQWGWHSDYIKNLKEIYLKENLIPIFDLAVWLFRTREWHSNIQATDVIDAFLKEFFITEEEHILFDLTPPPLTNPWLQAEVITYQALLNIVGTPIAEGGATLEQLKLTQVGPTREIECKFTPRLNLITGDNGLGKTFLLECAWWALTGTWARAAYPAYPRRDAPKNAPRISFQIGNGLETDRLQVARYNWDAQEWIEPAKRDVLPGLSIFAQADGSFAVWDPAKHLLLESKRGNEKHADALIRFSRTEIWQGIRDTIDNREIYLSNGLIRDWYTWQTSDPQRFKELCAALEDLSPHPTNEPLIPGEPIKLPPDSRPIPTLKFSYGEVPIVLCSAGIQRILTLAYLLVWAWHEHLETSESMRREPEHSIVLLIDEMEAHLHPFWQRVIAPALIKVVQRLSKQVKTQLIIATHSPLVLASVEDFFDEAQDSLFHLYLENKQVQLNKLPFVKRGRVDLWLMSDLFGLKHPRSKVAEDIIERAKNIQRSKEPQKEEILDIYQKLITVLAPDDEFWPRWTYFAETQGVVL